MPKFAANVSMLFTEHPFLERFAHAKAAGFQAVEFLFPYEHDTRAIADELRRNELEQVLFNLPAGNFAAGDRGMATYPRKCRRQRSSRICAMPPTLPQARVSCRSSSHSTRSTLLVTFCPHRNRDLPSLSELRIPISCCNTTSITPSA